MKSIKNKLFEISAGCLLLLLGCGQASGATSGLEEVADIPMGQDASGEVSLLPEDVGDVDEESVFGTEGGYFHPYITLDFSYTDNLYNIEEGETENLLTTISPGIWFALPRKKIIPITINPHNSSPGGLQLQFEDYEGTDKFQAYALGGIDYKIYSEDSDLDNVDGILEGLVRYNMSSGLSLQAVDRFTRSEDKIERGSGTRNQVRDYMSNFLMLTGDWDITEKVRLQLDYFNFLLSYDDEINEFLDRVDNGINLYGYYHYSLLTSFFLEYKYVDVTYDISSEVDNTNQFIYGGIKWDSTEKLAVLFKVGFQDKVFDTHVNGQEDFDGIAFDLQFTYRYSEKTLLEFDVYMTNEETDNYLASDKDVLGATLNYYQRFSDRWTADVRIMYENADYNNFDQLTSEDREDENWIFRPALQYLMREWLEFELAYRYETRDSSDDYFDYDTNTFLFNANFSL